MNPPPTDLLIPGRFVQVHRPSLSHPRLSGVVVAAGGPLVLVRPFHDFTPEGFAILRACDVVEVRHGERERLWERMLRGEGLLGTPEAEAAAGAGLPLGGLRSALAALVGRHVIIEREGVDPADDTFSIGPLLAVDDEAATQRIYDSLGRWEDEPEVTPLDRITQVQFDTPYDRTFAKYLPAS